MIMSTSYGSLYTLFNIPVKYHFCPQNLWHKHVKQESDFKRATLKGWKVLLAKERLKGLKKELESEL